MVGTLCLGIHFLLASPERGTKESPSPLPQQPFLQLSFASHSCHQLWAVHIGKTSFEASSSNLERGRAKDGRVVRREMLIPSR